MLNIHQLGFDVWGLENLICRGSPAGVAVLAAAAHPVAAGPHLTAAAHIPQPVLRPAVAHPVAVVGHDAHALPLRLRKRRRRRRLRELQSYFLLRLAYLLHLHQVLKIWELGKITEVHHVNQQQNQSAVTAAVCLYDICIRGVVSSYD